jgi:pimeloyl-ACP methyl ester carboxylesterase
MNAVDVNGTRLEVVEQGAGTPMVLVHGSASDYRTWREQLDAFSRRYRVIAYSRRYHWPNEPIPDGADYSMAQHVDDLQALLRALVDTPAHVVGHSYGALLALLLAARDPGLVRTLVLAEPPAITLFVSDPPKPAEVFRLLLSRPRTAMALLKFGATGVGPATAAARRGDMDVAMRVFGRTVLGDDYHARLASQRREQVAANAIAAEFLGSGYLPLEDDVVRKVLAPTLLVSGQDSPSLFHHLIERLEELLPRTERVTIPRASHIMHEDNASAYARAVLSFLEARRGS